MKKTITLLSMALLGFASLPSYAQFKLGVKVGVDVNSVGYRYESSDDQKEADEEEDFARDNTKSKIGYTIGLAAEYGFTESLSLQTGLQLANKGYKFEYSDSEEDDDASYKFSTKVSTSVHYLEIPLNLAYKISKFQIHAGLYVGFGIAGKAEYDIDSEVTSGGETMKFSDSDDIKIKFKNKVSESDEDDLDEDETYIRRTDLGLNLGIGYNAGPVLLTATYSKGLSNLEPTSEDDDDNDSVYKQTNKGFRIAATWYFNR